MMAKSNAPEFRGATARSEACGMTRRNFVTAAMGGTLAALSIAGCSATASSADSSMQSASASEAAESDDGIGTVHEASETVECDFVVVGGGMGGLSAAVTAVQEGCENVVLLEKNSALGGSSNFAEGIYVNGSQYAIDLGYDPYPVESIVETESTWSHGIIDKTLFTEYLEGAPEYVAWLVDLGVAFSGISGPTPATALSATYDGRGAAAVSVLSATAEELGVDIRTSTPATALLVEGDAVVGVQAKSGGNYVDFKAPTVVLASGGCASNEAVMDEYTRLERGKWVTCGAEGQDGDAMKMVEQTSHGRAKHVCPQNMWLSVPGISINDDLVSIAAMEGTNIWVNQNAQRFFNEALVQDFYTATNTVANQGIVYSIFDKNHIESSKTIGGTCAWSVFCAIGRPIEDAQELVDAALENDEVDLWSADSIEELAEQAGLDADALKATVDAWNADVASGTDSQFGKDAAYMQAVSEAPFYAARIVNVVLDTMGGVRVDTQGRVTSPEGVPIEGLYAAGITATGFSGEVYGSGAPGSNQGPAVYLGRLAGKAAAKRMSA